MKLLIFAVLYGAASLAFSMGALKRFAEQDEEFMAMVRRYQDAIAEGNATLPAIHLFALGCIAVALWGISGFLGRAWEEMATDIRAWVVRWRQAR